MVNICTLLLVSKLYEILFLLHPYTLQLRGVSHRSLQFPSYLHLIPGLSELSGAFLVIEGTHRTPSAQETLFINFLSRKTSAPQVFISMHCPHWALQWHSGPTNLELPAQLNTSVNSLLSQRRSEEVVLPISNFWPQSASKVPHRKISKVHSNHGQKQVKIRTTANQPSFEKHVPRRRGRLKVTASVAMKTIHNVNKYPKACLQAHWDQPVGAQLFKGEAD